MAFKPLSQTVTSGKTLEIPSSAAVFSAIAAVLPSSVAGDVDKVLSVDALGVKSWQYAGLGAGSLGADTVILGRSKPTNYAGSANILVGPGAGNALTSGASNILIGLNAGSTLTTSGFGSVAIGRSAMASAAAANNGCVVIGYEAGQSLQNPAVVAIGFRTAQSAGGTGDVLIGQNAGSDKGNSGGSSVGIGYFALQYPTGTHNTAIGGESLRGVLNGSAAFNTAIGYNSGKAIQTGSSNIFIGYTAGDSVTTGNNNVIIGDIAGTANLSNTVIVASGTVERLRINPGGYVGLGLASPSSPLDVSGSAEVSGGDFIVSTVGNGIRLNTDTNSKLGTTAAFPATSPNTVTVSTTAVRSNSKIFVTPASNPGGHQPDVWVDSITDSTNFVLKAHDTNFNGTVNWFIIDPLYEPDSETFFTAAGITDATQKLAVDTLVRDLKRYGIWSKMKAIYPMVGGTATAHSYNLKNTTTFQITWNGTVTHNSSGITGNGTNGYGNTNLIPSTDLSLNSTHISSYTSSTIGGGTLWDMGCAQSNQSDRIGLGRIASTVYGAISQGSWNSVAASPANGLFTASRVSSSDVKLYSKQTAIVTATTASSSLATQQMYIAGYNLNGALNSPSSYTYSWFSVGDGLTSTDVANLYTAVQAFQAALDRSV